MLSCLLFLITFLTTYSYSFFFYEHLLKECPNINEAADINMDMVVGSWRLAYFFMDEPGEDYDEEDTCAVTDIDDYNGTHLRMNWYIENMRGNQIDRSTFVLPVTLLTKGEWIVATPFGNSDFIHATVISQSEHHLILTFCGTQQTMSNNGIAYIQQSYNVPEQPIRRDEKMDSLITNKVLNHPYFQQTQINEPNLETYEQGFRYKRNVHRRKRTERQDDSENDLITALDSLKAAQKSDLTKWRSYLNQNKVNNKEKHLWTVVLLKNNAISALRFVQYATVLMKFGFKVTDGELISFGKCQIVH